jgi:hypothetical protein
MSRNLKVLGLALVALFALSAISASAAFAESTFTTTAGATLTGNQPTGTTQKFTVTGQTTSCTNVKFEAIAPSADFASVDVAANYEGCTAAGFTAHIEGFAKTAAQIGEAGKCWYTLNANGSSALKCNGGDVTVNASPCVVHVPAQSFASGLTFHNSEGVTPDDVTVTFNVTGIRGTHTDGFLCPFGSSGESNEGILEGESTVTAEEGEKKVNATWDA